VTPLTFMSVATNRYLDYWFKMYESYRTHNYELDDVFFQVFTDRESEALEYCKKNDISNVSVIAIPAYSWPEATILRYEIFSALGIFKLPGIYAHIDADMLFIDFKEMRNRVLSLKEDLLFVTHPGFFRPKGLKRFDFYSNKPICLAKDIYMYLKLGGIGAWETDRVSGAFVPYWKRRNYCCGGVWLGNREAFLSMCNELSTLVKEDFEIGVLAKWHDESFLNMYLAKLENIEILGPEFCFVDGYAQLKGVNPLIKALEKGENRTR